MHSTEEAAEGQNGKKVSTSPLRSMDLWPQILSTETEDKESRATL